MEMVPRLVCIYIYSANIMSRDWWEIHLRAEICRREFQVEAHQDWAVEYGQFGQRYKWFSGRKEA